jgi:hypothetical protein
LNNKSTRIPYDSLNNKSTRIPYDSLNNKSTRIPYDLSNNKPIPQSPSIMDSVKTGMGFGFGSSVGHSIFNGLFGEKAEETYCKNIKNDFDKCLKETNECTIDNMKYLTYILEKCKNI